MAAALNAFMQIGGAEGESKQAPYDKPPWIELQSWDWEVEAETSWTKGGGAAVGKPSPGKMNWEHVFDRSSNTILTYICTGKAFPNVTLEMCKSTGAGKGAQAFFTVKMNEVFITKVNAVAPPMKATSRRRSRWSSRRSRSTTPSKASPARSPGALANAGDVRAGTSLPARLRPERRRLSAAGRRPARRSNDAARRRRRSRPAG